MKNSVLNKPLAQLIAEIDDPRSSALLRLYEDHKDLFHYAKGSSHNHQAWPGGYADHLAEILRVNEVTYAALETIRPLDFSQASAAIALFFHDAEKPFRYGPVDSSICNEWRARAETVDWEELKWDIIAAWEQQYGFTLTAEERHALKYCHGEGDDHRKDQRVATPLAAHVHHCDNTSARIWPEDGQGLS